MLNKKLHPNITLPDEYVEEAVAWHPLLDLVALTDSVHRDWIWWNGSAFYVGTNHLPGAQLVVRAATDSNKTACKRLDDLHSRHLDYPHPACKSLDGTN